MTVASFFGADGLANNMKCEDLNAKNGCGADAAVGCKDVNNPAGELILNSFLQVNSVRLGRTHTKSKSF